MATPKETLWEIDQHTKAKHDILRRYLTAWFPILGTQYSRVVYIDGFCGPGRYKGGEPGSPIVAVRAAINHYKEMRQEIVFWFIDERQYRIDYLKQELGTLDMPAHFKVFAETGRFDEKFERMMDQLEGANGKLAPTFAFIDPFGFSGIPFHLLERLLKQKHCEIFITFMVDAINRFLEHPDDKVVEHIVQLFGTDEAKSIAWGTGDRVVKLRELYQSRLKSIAKYVRYFEMRDRRDRRQYYLFFATNHALGHLKMKEAMWGVDPDGEFKFSDATNPNQMVLFETDTTSAIIRLMRTRFGGAGTVSCKDVREFVEEQTAYLSKHMKAALKQEEARGGIVVEDLKTNGTKRRKGTYPDNVMFRFEDNC
ncbi:MAG: three-Cys-motif partner protein TcmP [Myxococcota bacterium]|jgi:three-Cys-motif partner protein